jgi:hypothetical protein
MDIEAFYDENPARRASEEFEFGRDWTDDEQYRCEVSWVQDTGELYLMTAPVEPIVADGAGDEFVQRLPTRAVTVEVLDTVPSIESVEAMLAGWADAMPEPGSVRWVRDRVAGGAPAAGEAARPEDEPTEVDGAGDRGARRRSWWRR